ncbi:MAG: hypothetical protein HYU28_08505 [Actinobacteria bacterium]|nr:hypothetical protein [Actinomycetota bacterium]
MTRPTRFEEHQYLGDKRVQRVHDLDAATDACAVDELMASEKFAAFGPDTLAEAANRGYRPCRHCLPRAREEGAA